MFVLLFTKLLIPLRTYFLSGWQLSAMTALHCLCALNPQSKVSQHTVHILTEIFLLVIHIKTDVRSGDLVPPRHRTTLKQYNGERI